ncbi:hypothetical protein ABK040_014324 [Willaertia magna]
MCFGSNSDIQRRRALNHKIEEENRKKALEANKEIKLLLLGAGESGKSTLFKQVKLIHSNGYDTEELNSFIPIVRGNVITSISQLINATARLGFEMKEENKQIATELESFSESNIYTIVDNYNEQLGEHINGLWQDEAIQKAYQRRNEFQLYDSAKYFLDDIKRISKKDYRPTIEDVLKCRVKTTGLVECIFEMDNLKFRLVDVGGQRNERKKWIHCFENVTMLLFVVSLSEYDQNCYEDEMTHRMKESLSIFAEIVNCKFFEDTPVLLFLNKRDLFEEKLKTKPITMFFRDYKGAPESYEESLEYIKNSFLSLAEKKERIKVHVTCATDTENIRHVFDAVKNDLLKKNLK